MTPEHRISALLPLRPGRHAGFTLVELMIVMVVAAILAAIAIPMYLNQVRESRRTDARSALLELAGREERYYATNNTYTNSAAALGYSGWGSGYPIGNGYYYLDQPNVPAAAPDPTPPAAPSYSITAVPIYPQTADTCASLTVDSTGQQTAVLTSGGQDTTGTCWGGS
jgi:type IV pilus assembly protein PilE